MCKIFLCFYKEADLEALPASVYPIDLTWNGLLNTYCTLTVVAIRQDAHRRLHSVHGYVRILLFSFFALNHLVHYLTKLPWQQLHHQHLRHLNPSLFNHARWESLTLNITWYGLSFSWLKDVIKTANGCGTAFRWLKPSSIISACRKVSGQVFVVGDSTRSSRYVRHKTRIKSQRPIFSALFYRSWKWYTGTSFFLFIL